MIKCDFEYFGSKIRHTAKDKAIYTKSSMYALEVKFSYTTAVAVNIFKYELHPQLFQILVLHALASMHCSTPHYSLCINKLKVMVFNIESTFALDFLIGYLRTIRKLSSLLQFHHSCMNALEDCRMPFIKLSKCWNCTYSLGANFQMLKCSYMLNSILYMP